MTAAARRCERAFNANHIPWDAALESLPDYVLEDTAAFWEDKVKVKPLTTKECVQIIRSIQPVPPAGTQKGRCVSAANLRYRGS